MPNFMLSAGSERPFHQAAPLNVRHNIRVNFSVCRVLLELMVGNGDVDGVKYQFSVINYIDVLENN